MKYIHIIYVVFIDLYLSYLLFYFVYIWRTLPPFSLQSVLGPYFPLAPACLVTYRVFFFFFNDYLSFILFYFFTRNYVVPLLDFDSHTIGMDDFHFYQSRDLRVFSLLLNYKYK